MNRRLMLALAPAAALAFGALAFAQPPGPGPGGPAVHMMHGPGGPEMKAMHEAMMKQHVEDLKTVLRLRPDQEAALQAFIAAHHAGGPMMMEHGPDAMHDPAAAKPQTTPERLAEMARREAAMAAEHEKARQALAKFYAALNPDQQRVFDALQRLQGPHGGHMGGPDGMRRIEIHRVMDGPAAEAEHHHD